MKLLTIGEFARAARLSPKALRLYDELGLLRPDRVDPASGYRYYSPDQLERARLVAWLRRLGMPLAQIAAVCDAPPLEGAKAIAAADSGPAGAETPDLSLHEARDADRYLLCSDGLTAVVPVAVIRKTLLAPGSAPSDVVRRLISLANEAGGPDNIACVVADVSSAA